MIVALLAIAALFAAGAGFQWFGETLDARRYPPPGQRFAVPGGPRLHLYSQGDPEAPTVVFEAGISGSSLSWASVQPLVAKFANATAYDRAGLGWSAGVLTPRTVDIMITELAALLDAGKVPGPCVFVGHSFGCLLLQCFAARYPEKATALVFVDPVSRTSWANATPRDLHRVAIGSQLARRGAWLARFGVVRAALWLLMSGSKLIPKLVAGVSAGPGNSTVERLIGEVRKLPPETHPKIAAHWCRANSFVALSAYLQCLPECARTALPISVPSSIPMVILSAGNATAAELAERNAWAAAHGNTRHLQIEGTGHWLQLERPAMLADVIRETLPHVR